MDDIDCDGCLSFVLLGTVVIVSCDASTEQQLSTAPIACFVYGQKVDIRRLFVVTRDD